MNEGYIYIFINKTFLDCIKIGCSRVDPSVRAENLSKSSGVPTPYRVAYKIFVKDKCRALEKEIHTRLKDFRVSNKREFFRYPLSGAIEITEEICMRV